MSNKYKCEVFNSSIRAANLDSFEKILKEYAADGWALDKVIPQIDSSSSYSYVDDEHSVDCLTSVDTCRNILVFKR